MAKRKAADKSSNPDASSKSKARVGRPGKAAGINKTQIIREAIKELGHHAKPTLVLNWIEEKHGAEIASAFTAGYISTIKSEVIKRQEVPARLAGQDALMEIVDIVGKIGIEEARRMADLAKAYGGESLSDLVDNAEQLKEQFERKLSD